MTATRKTKKGTTKARDPVPERTPEAETVLWALAKLHEELAFYADIDRLKGRATAKLLREIREVANVRDSIMDKTLVLVTNGDKEND